MRPEATLQEQVCDYLKLQYPGTIFHSDFASGMKMTVGQAMRCHRIQSSRAWPDIFVAEPRDGWCGLFIELKAKGTTIFKKDGEITSNIHIQEQNHILSLLRLKGYKAEFAVGFESAKKIIDEYFGRNI